MHFLQPTKNKILLTIVLSVICFGIVWLYSFFSLDLCGGGLPVLVNAGPTPTPVPANLTDTVNNISGIVTEGSRYCPPSNLYNPDEYAASYDIAATIVEAGFIIITIAVAYIVSSILLSQGKKKQRIKNEKVTYN